jgi:hypothetical protein
LFANKYKQENLTFGKSWWKNRNFEKEEQKNRKDKISTIVCLEGKTS